MTPTNPVQIDREDLQDILEAVTSGAARLKGERCPLSDTRAAWALLAAAVTIREALEKVEA